MNSPLYAGLRYQASEPAAKVMGIAVQPPGVREPDDFEYHRWLLEGTIPKAGRIHKFSDIDNPTIQLLEDAGLPLTLHDSATLLDTLTQILRKHFRVKPGQPLSKPRISKASELADRIVSAARKTRLRAISANFA